MTTRKRKTYRKKLRKSSYEKTRKRTRKRTHRGTRKRTSNMDLHMTGGGIAGVATTTARNALSDVATTASGAVGTALSGVKGGVEGATNYVGSLFGWKALGFISLVPAILGAGLKYGPGMLENYDIVMASRKRKLYKIWTYIGMGVINGMHEKGRRLQLSPDMNNAQWRNIAGARHKKKICYLVNFLKFKLEEAQVHPDIINAQIELLICMCNGVCPIVNDDKPIQEEQAQRTLPTIKHYQDFFPTIKECMTTSKTLYNIPAPIAISQAHETFLNEFAQHQVPKKKKRWRGMSKKGKKKKQKNNEIIPPMAPPPPPPPPPKENPLWTEQRTQAP